MPNIFVSYRRSDSAAETGRICDRLRSEFPKNRLFWDMDSISTGSNFKQSIRNSLEETDVLLAMIGRDWISPRLHQGDDMVRLEIEEAFSLGVRVIPVLLNGAPVPGSNDVPESLHQLVFRQARPVRPDPDFRFDLDLLISDLKRIDVPSTNEQLKTLREKLISARTNEELRRGLYEAEAVIDRFPMHPDARVVQDLYRTALDIAERRGLGPSRQNVPAGAGEGSCAGLALLTLLVLGAILACAGIWNHFGGDDTAKDLGNRLIETEHKLQHVEEELRETRHKLETEEARQADLRKEAFELQKSLDDSPVRAPVP